ncbi:hypothetical protein LTR91_014412 [Friedmanniomyces endolithicus]|uniref:Enoyl reductase (ER) domain-containing protein n=1 Tax=Friedmanniomyces endolithicus TaxID=329885 RepID=A0AAN6KBP4_9PEZI|nr:hypothetical protein LTS09_014168 [Friedmanniomyces endolithicus]KAK0334662.1 hypothetical protein LTR94_015945 [Friedmanniomyces endolithicus]KAK0776511.1 hypothetical protein LTR59_014155 [Friedmanniomyces endolithicus]KAK0782074.1 hypothetical protein LTR38_013511 [Friedmanniomyces endolithicus]KAK0786569.1 hypothetical protein LTR75_013176 [Friedmanniomyces endolithicus]
MAGTETPRFKQWQLSTTLGIDGLNLVEDASIAQVGDEEVLVEMHAASLNFLDLFVAKGGQPGTLEQQPNPGLVTGCDGSGIIKAVGAAVKDFAPGDRIVTHLIGRIPDDAKVDFDSLRSSLGMGTNGTLTQYGKFHHSNLVHAPRSLSFEQAATLPCSGLTAYNALFGLGGRQVQRDQWVLVQGTGGVSVAALQIAVAVGAHVVATTSSAEKAVKLEILGAKHVLNYRDTPEWGVPARAFTPGKVGFDHVVDIGGDATLGESVKAVKTDGVVSTIGLLGGPADQQVPMMAAFQNACIVRGLVAGTRQQMRDFVAFVDEKGMKPALDDMVFGIEDARKAYWRQERQQHFPRWSSSCTVEALQVVRYLREEV